jgi:ribosomal-protein-serine acetyltransferase
MFTMRIDDELELQLYEERHSAELFDLISKNRDYLRRWMTDFEAIQTPADEQASAWRLMQRFARGACTAAAISYKGHLAGGIALHTDRVNNRATIGYWLGEVYQHKGIMTRACRAMVNYAFSELAMNRVEIRAASENRASRAIPERLGLTYEGLARRSSEWEELDSAVYGVLADEWPIRSDGAARFRLRIEDDIELRLLEQRHSEELFDLIERNREKLSKWFLWAAKQGPIEDTRRFITESLEKRADGQGYQAGIWVAGSLAGAIGYAGLDKEGNWAAIGYWLDADHEGKGIATKACRAVVDEAFRQLGLRSVEIRAAADNQRSRRVAERLGFKKEAVTRRSDRLPHGYADTVIYGLLACEWTHNP